MESLPKGSIMLCFLRSLGISVLAEVQYEFVSTTCGLLAFPAGDLRCRHAIGQNHSAAISVVLQLSEELLGDGRLSINGLTCLASEPQDVVLVVFFLHISGGLNLILLTHTSRVWSQNVQLLLWDYLSAAVKNCNNVRAWLDGNHVSELLLQWVENLVVPSLVSPTVADYLSHCSSDAMAGVVHEDESLLLTIVPVKLNFTLRIFYQRTQWFEVYIIKGYHVVLIVANQFFQTFFDFINILIDERDI